MCCPRSHHLDATSVIRFLSASEFEVVGGEEIREWRESLRVDVPGSEFNPRLRKLRGILASARKAVDLEGIASAEAALRSFTTWAPGRVRSRGEEVVLRCSRGLLPRLQESFDFEIADAPSPVSVEEFAAFLEQTPNVSKLRPYQTTALDAALRSGWGRIAQATNSGKGAVIALCGSFARSKGKRVLVCCDELSVFDALLGELRTWARTRPELVNAGVKSAPSSGFVLAMIPTLARRVKTPEWRKWLASVDMLLLDEADRALSNSWRAVLDACGNATWRLGFSGSFPTEELEDLQLEELMGPIVAETRNAELIDAGISARPSVELHRFNSTARLVPFPDAWWAWACLDDAAQRRFVFEHCIVYNEERHRFIAGLVQPGVRTVVIVNRVSHGRQLQQVIPGSVFLDGSAGNNERDAALSLFESGRVAVLITTKILDRGSNRLGTAADMIFASGEGSRTQTLQRIGRGLRRTGGKETLRLVDVVDHVDTEPLLASIRSSVRPPESDPRSAGVLTKVISKWIHASARRRLRLYAAEGFSVEVAR
jgi:superfamily II DNA or RNA helicase